MSPTGTDHKLLGIYLNDHFAGSVVGVELARRAAGSNAGTELGAFLERLVGEIESDRDALASLMEAQGVGRDPLKRGGAWVAEKLGRLKLNGRLTGYSPLSRLIELEGLMLGVTGKLGLWRALIAADVEAPEGVDLGALVASAERQRNELEEWRLRAAREAVGEAAASATRA